MPKHIHTALTDEELLQHYRQSNENEWLGSLLQRYTLLLFGVAMKYFKDKHLAEDAVQQIFLKVFTHLPADPIVNFKGWLYILMRNHCLHQLRRKEYFAPEDQLHQISEEETSISEHLEKETSLEKMQEALGELKEEQRLTIELFYLKKQSYQQITEQTGFNFMQVKSYIQNGKRNLKLILTQKMNNHHS